MNKKIPLNHARPKLEALKNFCLDENSNERKMYVEHILNNKTNRPEQLFISKFLSNDFWKELGYIDNEIHIESEAGDKSGRIEYTLNIGGKKIGIECKKPFNVKNDVVMPNILDGIPADKNNNQIKEYLFDHDIIIYTNGLYWYFYTKSSYKEWRNLKKSMLAKPYFLHLTAKEIFDKNSIKYVDNLLQRSNLLNSLKQNEDKALRYTIGIVNNEKSQNFFMDLKTWMQAIDFQLTHTEVPVQKELRTINLINKLIFVRTMESYGILKNEYLHKQLNNCAGNMKIVQFIDGIDEYLTSTYNTELFTSLYIENEIGDIALDHTNRPIFNEKRRSNYAYKNLDFNFINALLTPTNNLKNTTIKITRGKKTKEFNIKSMYSWKFDELSVDILGKAYETYLAIDRKKKGIYYTHHEITNYVSTKAIESLMNEKIKKVRNAFKKKQWSREEILKIMREIEDFKICDPSCGSGSFLIQAINILYKKYSELEKLISYHDRQIKTRYTLDDYTSQQSDIISNCKRFFPTSKRDQIVLLILRHIYGNDKDPNAIDTTKLNIWLQCLRLTPNAFRKDDLGDAKHVLPNLELNITVGDSLIGLEPEFIDKKIDRSIIKKAYEYRKKYLISSDKTRLATLAVETRDKLITYSDTIFKQQLRNYAQKIKNTQSNINTFEQSPTNILNIVKPCHWSLQHIPAFYNVDGTLKDSKNRGFDVILGNPPWEVLKPESDDFYGAIYNDNHNDRYVNINSIAKKRFITECKKSTFINDSWIEYEYQLKLMMEYFYANRSVNILGSIKYTVQGGSDQNLYKLFTELYNDLIKQGGQCGVVLPATFYSDKGSQELRNLIFTNFTVSRLCGFINTKNAFFNELHAQWLFAILIAKKGILDNKFIGVFGIDDPVQVSDIDDKVFEYGYDVIDTTSPTIKSVLSFKNIKDLQMINNLYINHPILSSEDWSLVFTSELHMTQNKQFFNQEKDGTFLYVGEIFHQFITLFQLNNTPSLLHLENFLNLKSTKQSYISEKNIEIISKKLLDSKKKYIKRALKNNIRKQIDDGVYPLSKEEKNFLINKTNQISSSKLGTFLNNKISTILDNLDPLHNDNEEYRLGWRDVTNASNTRTVIATILPPNVFLGNSINYLRPFSITNSEYIRLPPQKMMYLCGMMNSFIFDFMARIRVSIHVNIFQIGELPIPIFNANNVIQQKIIELTGGLVCITPEYNSLKKDLGISDIFTTVEDRHNALCELNILAAKLYGVSNIDFKHMLDTFSEKGENTIKHKIYDML